MGISLKDLQVPEQPYRAIHITWIELRELATDLLSRLLNRKVLIENDRSDYYDWGLNPYGGLTPEELETLFIMVEADDWDRDSNDFGDGEPVRELSQSLSRKLIGLLLPFRADLSHADDEGILFIGKSDDAMELII